MRVSNLETPKNRKLKELYTLLNTERGTVPLYRDLGLDKRMIDRPITVVQNAIWGELQRQVSKYIQGLELDSVECSPLRNGIEIVCEVSIIE